MTKVLVTGATGNVGSQVVRELKERGAYVRAFARDLDRAANMLGNDVEIAAGDFSDVGSIRVALDGVDALFLACGNHPDQVEHETGAIDAATAAGVRRIVKLSALGAEVGSPLAFWDWHGRIEERLRASGLKAVILRPAFYTTNLPASIETVQHTGRLFAPASGAGIAMIDPEDVAEVAAVVLTQDGREEQIYTLTGPQAITYEEIAGRLSDASGRKIEFIPVPDEAARQAMIESGMPEFVAEQLVILFGLLRGGAQARPTNEVRMLTGREPRSFAEFARNFARLVGEPRSGALMGT